MTKLAVVTGASSGIGLELARIAKAEGYDLVIAADRAELVSAAAELGAEPVEADLATVEGVDQLIAAVGGRPIDVLCANAGHGLGGPFLDQSPEEWSHVIDTNITGTIYLLQTALKSMVARGQGKILVTGSIAGYVPGPLNAVYNGTKSFVDNFTEALRNELKDVHGVTLTTLMPGATETEFFDRAGLGDTQVGESKKADPVKVARDGWDAMMAGTGHIVSGWMNKAQVAAAGVVPQSTLAEQHRKMAEPVAK